MLLYQQIGFLYFRGVLYFEGRMVPLLFHHLGFWFWLPRLRASHVIIHPFCRFSNFPILTLINSKLVMRLKNYLH